MIEDLATVEPGATPASVLATVRAERAAADAAEARLLGAAAEWADLHPPESIHDAATFWVRGFEAEDQVAGDGCPLVAEFCAAELGAALGTSTTAAKRLIGHALELRHRLPRLWRRVHAGDLPAWRARRVAETTIHADLTPEAAAYVDRMVAPFAHRTGPAVVDRLVAEAIARTTRPVLAEHPDDPAPSVPDTRHVTIHDQDVAYAGTVLLEAELDLADALDLDHAVRRGAESLQALGSDASLDARRAEALGDLVRRQLALDLGGATAGGRLPAARRLDLHVHLAASVVADTGTVTFDPLARLEEGQRQVLLDQVKEWCAHTHTQVVVRPVLDLAAHLSAPGYEPGEELREQVVQRDRTCLFPWCSRPARRCQVDHVVPYDHADPDAGGKTESPNLAALCVHHHRLKTHGGWSYVMPEPGVAVWRSPQGHHYLRDHTGTEALPEPGADPPRRR
ncbi:DUF222 domain-containing protein [Nocardioides sp. GXQ0305]|uniref:HNH endonuclease signature motif containing protein n=1 Tax=Nocardioides sp. GXQ0305 TaxID=3423912 RepID=UPI003D7CA5F2